MKFPGTSNQSERHHLFDASGTITTGGTPQILLPDTPSRSYLLIENTSAATLYVDFGGARATATLTGDKVTSFAITNAGIGYTMPPSVRIWGGGWAENNLNQGLAVPGGEAPHQAASAVATISGGAVTAITLSNGGGSKYAIAPFVFLETNPRNPYASATVSATSGGIQLTAGGSLVFEGLTCPTDAVAIFGASNGQAFTCKWMQ